MFFTYYALRCPSGVGRTLFKHNNFPILRRTITTTPIRSNMFNVGKRMRSEKYYAKLDKMEPTYELIYCAPFEYLAALSRHVPTFGLIVVSSLLAYKWIADGEVIDTNAQYESEKISLEGSELKIFLVAFYVFNLTLAYGVTKYPLRIYKSKNQYCAMFEGYLPFRPRPYRFTKGEVSATKSILPWQESIYKMKDRKVLVYSHHFKRPGDFHEMSTK